MKYVLISVEGDTEETFIRDVFAPYYAQQDIHVQAIKLTPKGSLQKGGIPKYAQVRKELWNLLQQAHVALVTTLYDFYGLPNDFPGKDTVPPTLSCYDRVAHLETELAREVGHPKFLPHLQLHEFEAFVFIDEEVTAQQLLLTASQRTELQQVIRQFPNPEEINDKPETAPSRRIKTICNAYGKVNDGGSITKALSLSRIRQACPHFDAWCTALDMRLAS